MSSFSDAADFIKRQAKLHEGFVTAAAMLDKIGSVDQAAKEANAERDRAVAALDKAKADLVSVAAKTEDAHAMAADIMIKAGNEAMHQSELVILKAQADAQTIIASAAAHKAKTDATCAAAISKADAELHRLKLESEAATASAATAMASLAESQKEHDKLAKAIEAMKAKFA